jgi:hypothetical protein
MKFMLAAAAYVLSLMWLGASLCAGGLWLMPIASTVVLTAILFGWTLHRRLYGKRR